MRRSIETDISAATDELHAIVSSRLNWEKIICVKYDGYKSGGRNLIQMAMSEPSLRQPVEILVENGWVLYKSGAEDSSFVHQSHIGRVWHRVKNGELTKHRTGLIYQLENFETDRPTFGLVVVFSSMADVPNESGLARYCYRNFSSLGKHVGPGIAVLRIADIDSAVGGFYLPTTWDPDRHIKVEALIEDIADELSVVDRRVVLYGPSKGGTGALFYSLFSQLRWACVAIDPVVDDHYYESRHNDLHWTAGNLFKYRKKELFLRLADAVEPGDNESRIAIISSPRSPLCGSIQNVVESIPRSNVMFGLVDDDKIMGHADVSRRSVHITSSLINLFARDVPIGSGLFYI